MIYKFSGCVTEFESQDRVGHVIKPNAFKIFEKDNLKIPVFVEHNPKNKIGYIEKMYTQEKCFIVEGIFRSNYNIQQIKSQNISLSIGFFVEEFFYEKNILNITKGRIREISFVKTPAHPAALIYNIELL